MPVIRKNGFHPRVLEHPSDPSLYVYCLTDFTAIKIGKSRKHPIVRLKELQVGNPRPLTLIAYTTTLTESQAHRQLSSIHLRGEWFRMADRIVKLVIDWDWLDSKSLRLLPISSSQENSDV